MDPVYRTLLYKIHSGCTPNIQKNFKDPWHKKSVAHYGFPSLLEKYRPRNFDIDLHLGNHGNYLLIRLLAVKADDLVYALLKQDLLLGKFLADNAHAPNKEGVVVTQLQQWYGGPHSIHLFELTTGDEIPLATLEQINRLDGARGSIVHCHYFRQEVILSLDFELAYFRPWLEMQTFINSVAELDWLHNNAAPIDKNAPHSMIRYRSTS